jgi:hypothetical protein
MKIERRWSLTAQIPGAMAISVVLLSGCGGSTQSASSATDASSLADIAASGTGSASIASILSADHRERRPRGEAPTTSSSSSSSGATSGSGSLSGATARTNVTLSWSAPTENTNGSALTNLAGYIIYYGSSASAMTQTIDINTVGVLTYVVDNLSAGNWYFQIVAVNSAGEQSSPSTTVNVSI